MPPRRIQGIQMNEVVGWAKSEDGRMAVIGFRDQAGQELVLGCAPDNLWKAMTCFIDANAAFPVETGIGAQRSLETLDIAAIDLGQSVETGEVILAVHRPNGATLPLRISREGAAKLRDALSQALAG
jgi:hypothetical protein